MRWKVEVQSFPTSRRTHATEQYKSLCERSRKKWSSNYGPQFNWSFSYVKSPLCEIRTRKKDTCGAFFKTSVVPHISFRLPFVCELKKIHANQLVTERGQWSGVTASLILGARATSEKFFIYEATT